MIYFSFYLRKKLTFIDILFSQTKTMDKYYTKHVKQEALIFIGAPINLLLYLSVWHQKILWSV